MSIQSSAPESIQELLQPLEDGKFRFACHPGVPCFTECCRDLRLLLTPYDILRLKTHLKLSARDFLDLYTDSREDNQRHLPMVYLQMNADKRRTCPFVTPQGCNVYEGRPSACRIYPIARASRMHRVHGTVQENYFLLRESHCQGFEETKLWDISEWIEDQGLEPYHRMNNLWMEVITHPKLLQGSGISVKQQQMFFLASYNLEKFREFVFESRFLEMFEFANDEIVSLREDDEALLHLAFKWLSFSLLGEPSLTMRNAGGQAVPMRE